MTTLGEILKEKLQATALPQVQAAAAWVDQTEVVRWWKASEQTPPLDVDVLCAWGDHKGAWIGAYILHHGWVGADGASLDPPPRYWCMMPTGPIDEDRAK